MKNSNMASVLLKKIFVKDFKCHTVANHFVLGFGTQKVSCKFDEDCGYVDESGGANRWIPYIDHNLRN